MIRLLGIFLLTQFLASCATIAPQATNTYLGWQKRQSALYRIHGWQLTGKIAVLTAQDSGSATIDWTKTSSQFNISLLGPLGSGGMQLTGRSGFVQANTADGKHYVAQSPEALLAQTWGFNVPVSFMNYWIRGLPVPGLPKQSQFDDAGRLSTLDQSEWHVQFLNYTPVNGIDLPSRITITSPQLKVKLIIYSWKI